MRGEQTFGWELLQKKFLPPPDQKNPDQLPFAFVLCVCVCIAYSGRFWLWSGWAGVGVWWHRGVRKGGGFSRSPVLLPPSPSTCSPTAFGGGRQCARLTFQSLPPPPEYYACGERKRGESLSFIHTASNKSSNSALPLFLFLLDSSFLFQPLLLLYSRQIPQSSSIIPLDTTIIYPSSRFALAPNLCLWIGGR